MSELNSNVAKEPSMPDQIFAGYNIAIVTDSENVASVLVKAFMNRGGKVSSFTDGQKALEVGRTSHFHVLIVTEGIAQYDAAYCAKAIREQKTVSIDVLWHIGKESIPLMDGFLPRPFRPIELLKPIYEKLIQKTQKAKEAPQAQASAPAQTKVPAPAAAPSPGGAQSPAQTKPLAQAKAPAPAAAPVQAPTPAPVPAGTKAPAATETLVSAAKPVKRRNLKKILVVDDEEDLREVTMTILKNEGYEVISACNGIAALEAIKENRDISVMLLDLKMPGLNGIQLLTAIRNLGLGMDPCHIIIVSAFQRPELVESAKKLGVTHWVSKPFNPDLLLEYIHKAPAPK